MPRVELTSHLRRHVDLTPGEVTAATVREALEVFLVRGSRAFSYVFDEQGELRRHVTLFVDGASVDRRALDRPIAPDATLYIMQALSGG